MHGVDAYSSCGRGAYVNDAAHVRSHRVDGSVRAEAGWVNLEVGGALIHNVAKYVHLYLKNKNYYIGIMDLNELKPTHHNHIKADETQSPFPNNPEILHLTGRKTDDSINVLY